MLIFDASQEANLRQALGLPERTETTETGLAARFDTYWAINAFADDEQLSYERVVDFNP